MKSFFRTTLILLALTLISVSKGQAQLKPNTFVLDGDILQQGKFKIDAGNEQYLSAQRRLVAHASAPLERAPYTIIHKSILPASGNKHDFFSLATYWWPDPTKPGGLPYINKDGYSNPEAAAIKDNQIVRELSKDVRLLGLAYYFTKDEKYAKKATDQIRVFFINSATRMNPHLNYTQAIRGINDGRGVGIIDSEPFVDLIDGIQLLAGSNSWTSTDQAALKSWFSQYLNWMLNSTVGKEGAAQLNNIGTLYEVQVVAYALFVGNTTLAKSRLQNQIMPRIAGQFNTDGSQPREITRAKSWTYCVKNLNAWFKIASLAEKVDVDLWNYSTSDGRSLKKGFLWMRPFAAGEKTWQYEQLYDTNKDEFIHPSRIASGVYKDINLQSVLSKSHPTFKAGGIYDLLITRYY